MGLKKSDTDTFVKTLRQATNPEQVKSMISTYLKNYVLKQCQGFDSWHKIWQID